MKEVYNYICPGFFRQGYYRCQTDIVVAAYLTAHRDIAGFAEYNPRLIAEACHTTQKKLQAVLKHFEELGKVRISPNRQLVWWEEGIFHSLYKGNKASYTQRIGVSRALHTRIIAGGWTEDDGEKIVQLYVNKYDIDIPYPPPKRGFSDTLSSESKPESETESGKPDGSFLGGRKRGLKEGGRNSSVPY